MGKIGMPEALAFVEVLTDAEICMVRAAARKIVEAAHGEETH